jgi:hypothetical protein
MFAPEHVPKLQRPVELSGADEKSRSVDLPFAFCFAHFFHPWGEGINNGIGISALSSCVGLEFFAEGEKESTRDRSRGQWQNFGAPVQIPKTHAERMKTARIFF